MNIFQGFLTKTWTKSVKSRRDVEMASISGPCGLAGSDATRCARPAPISSPFRRLDRGMKGPDPKLSHPETLNFFGLACGFN